MSLPGYHASVFGCALLLWVASASAQPTTPQQTPRPFAPDWTPTAVGWGVYVKKGCAQCHGIRSSKGRVAPDLARIQSGPGFYELGAAMWDHLPLMGAKMRKTKIERPTLTPLELVNVLAFIFTAQYNDEPGNAKAGERLFTAKACVQCHAVGGKGGTVGPALDALKHIESPCWWRRECGVTDSGWPR